MGGSKEPGGGSSGSPEPRPDAPEGFSRRWQVKLDYRIDEWRRSRVLKDPLAYLLPLRSGRPRVLRFRSGLEFRMDRDNVRTAKALVALAAEGADLAPDSTSNQYVWKVSQSSNVIETPDGVRFTLDSVSDLVFSETYLFDAHFEGFNLEGRIVFDVGANVGDTALYYARWGAEVHAFEPDPANYAELLRNLSLNPSLAPRVHPHAEALGRDGVIRFQAGLGGASGPFVAGRGTPIEVRSRSLGSALEGVDASRLLLLKTDCKGCEHELVQQDAIRRFPHVTMEYGEYGERGAAFGSGGLYRLQAALARQGFVRQRVFKQNRGFFSLQQHGVISAARAVDAATPPTLPSGRPA